MEFGRPLTADSLVIMQSTSFSGSSRFSRWPLVSRHLEKQDDPENEVAMQCSITKISKFTHFYAIFLVMKFISQHDAI